MYVYKQVETESFCAYLTDVLVHESQPSVRFLAEWTLIRLVLRSANLHSFLLNLLSQVYLIASHVVSLLYIYIITSANHGS